MSIRLSRWAMGMLVVAAVVLMSGRIWATYYALGPSKDEWNVKYDVEVSEIDSTTMEIVFTVTDEGRLKPFYSTTVVAFSKQIDSQGGRSYVVKEPIDLKTTPDGKHVGKAQIRKEFVDRAMIRILTLTVDGKRQTRGAAYYDIPLNKYLNNGSLSDSPLASPPRDGFSR